MDQTSQQEVYLRLYNHKIHVTKDMKKAEYTALYVPPEPPTVARLMKQNKAASSISRVPNHGLTIVTYPSGKKEDKKENALTPRGKSRNNYGGFFNS